MGMGTAQQNCTASLGKTAKSWLLRETSLRHSTRGCGGTGCFLTLHISFLPGASAVLSCSHAQPNLPCPALPCPAAVGLAVTHIANVSFWCKEDPVGLAAAGSSPRPEEQDDEKKDSAGSEPGSSSSSGGGGTSGWLWAIIGTVVGVAVSAAVWVGFRAWRKKKEQRQRVRRVEDSDLSKQVSSQSTSPALEDPQPPTEVLVVLGDAGCGPLPPERQTSNRSDDLNHMGAAMWNSRVGAIEGLELGEMLGRGSYGTAYRGEGSSMQGGSVLRGLRAMWLVVRFGRQARVAVHAHSCCM